MKKFRCYAAVGDATEHALYEHHIFFESSAVGNYILDNDFDIRHRREMELVLLHAELNNKKLFKMTAALYDFSELL